MNDSSSPADKSSQPSNGPVLAVERPHRRGEGSSGSKANALTPAFVLKAVIQWWLVAVPLGLVLAAGAGAAVYFTFEPEYRAEALLQVNSDPFLDQMAGKPEEVISTQRELMRTSLVLGPVLEKAAHFDEIKDAEDQVGFVAERLQVVSLSNTGLFKVSFVGTNPQQAAELVNQVVNSHLVFQSSLDQQRAHELMGKLNVELGKWHSKVESDGERVVSLERQALEQDPLGQRTRARPLDESSRLPLMSLMEKQAESGERISMTKARIAAMESAIEKDAVAVTEEEVEVRVNAHPEVVQIEQQIDAHRAILREIASKSSDGKRNANYVQIETLTKNDEARLEKLKEELRAELRELLKTERRLTLKAQISALQAELANYERTSAFYQSRFDAHLATLKEHEGPAFDLEMARWDLALSQDTLSRVRNSLNSIQLGLNAPADIKLMESAAVPSIPVERIPYKNILLAALAAFCAPFGLAVLWEYRVRRVSDSRQLEEQSALSVVGEVASFPVRHSGSRQSRGTARGMRLFEESIDSLRTYLVLAQPVHDIQVLTVTSASTREGKTSIASQLAVSIARATGEPTLIIDGDMRKPDVHEIFGIEKEPGLADLLAKEIEFDEAVNTSWSDRVHIMPAGKLATSPHRLLGNGALKAILTEARSRYRHIVIDTPPVLSAGEALVLSAAADAALVCVMRNYSRVEQVATTYNRLNAVGANVVGSVLSGVPAKQYAKYYGDYGFVRS